MDRVWRHLARFGLVVLGYGLAALAASGFLHLAVIGRETAHSLFLTVPMLALLIARVAFMPALAAILLAELFGLRSWLYHALGGAAVALVSRLLWLRLEDTATVDGADRLAFSMGAGIAGGLAYWLAAGRSAGAIAPGRSGS